MSSSSSSSSSSARIAADIKSAEDRYQIAKQSGDALAQLAAGQGVIQALKSKYA